jgi:hypothetical protein
MEIPSKPMAAKEIIEAAKAAFWEKIGLEVLVYRGYIKCAIDSADEVRSVVFYSVSALDQTTILGTDGEGREIGFLIDEMHFALPILIEKKQLLAA